MPKTTGQVLPPGYYGGSAPLPPPPQPGGGVAGATGGGFGAPPSSVPPLNNTVTPSADLTWLQEQYKARLGADPTKRAIAGATSGIRDATTGLAKELGGNLARRGISQSGIRTSGEQGLAQNAQRQIAGAAAGITQGRERDIDAMVMGGLPIMGAQDQLGLQKQGLGLQQWQAQNQAEIARQQLGLQAQAQAQQGQQAMMSLWSQYLNMFR
jgi:hypothetical protein